MEMRINPMDGQYSAVYSLEQLMGLANEVHKQANACTEIRAGKEVMRWLKGEGKAEDLIGADLVSRAFGISLSYHAEYEPALWTAHDSSGRQIKYGTLD